MKIAVRKQFWIVLFVIMLLMSMCACQPESPKSAVPETLKESSQILLSISKQVYPLPTGFTIDGLARMDKCLLIAGTKGDMIAFSLAAYTVSQTGSVSMADVRSLEHTATGHVCAAAAGDDGLFYVLCCDAADTEYPREYTLVQLDPLGTFTGSRAIRVDDPDVGRLNALVVTDSGTLIACSHTCYCIWPADSEKGAVFFDKNIRFYGLQNCSMGVLAAVFSDDPAHHGFHTIQIAENGSFSHLEGEAASLSNTQGLDGHVLFNDGSSVYSFDFEKGLKRELLSWNENMLRTDTTAIVQLDEKAFAYSFQGDDTLYLVSSVPQQLGQRRIVKTAVMDGADTSLLKRLNASDSAYYYEIKEYTGEREEVSIALTTDVVSGNGPDLILHCGSLDTDSRYFDDLYPYIDADETLSRGDFIPNILSALEVKGELHEIWSGTGVFCCSACVSDVGDGKDLNMDRLSLIAQHKEGCESVFNLGFHGEAILYWIGLYGCEDYIDKETGSCHFDDPAFAKLLEWCKTDGPSGYQEERSQSLLWQEYLTRGEQLKIAAQAWGEPFVLLGLPLTNESGTYFYSSNPLSPVMSIPANSACKEGAWAYIRAQLTVEEQIRNEYGDFPVIMEAFERRENKSTMPKQYYQMLVGLLENTDRAAKFSDYTLQKIIVDSGTAYLAGDRSAEETAALIQKRASLYLSEKYG